MSSSPQKHPPTKMCKSPKNINYQAIKPEKVQIINEYENFNTNCTVIGSNNLHLVKKPQIVTSMSPVYSNPSPGYPQSPYSSPASLKSPSPQSFKPPTPQPAFPVMQIIQSSHHLVARPIQTTQSQNVIKLKSHLNILPKPPASPQPSPKPSVSPQIVIPSQQTATIMPTAQPLLLNQMPVLTPGVQLILRPQTTKMPTHLQAAAHQGLILQSTPQQVLQIQSPRTAQPMVRVLTNGVQFSPHVTTPVITHTATQQIVHNDLAHGTVKKKSKKKPQRLDLANIMKLSGIGDEDDIQFESDTSQSESEPSGNIEFPQQMPINNVIHDLNVRSHTNVLHANDNTKRIGNIQISAVTQPTVSTATPLVQLLNQGFQSGISNANFHTQATSTGIPLNSFLTPNITINNGLVVQRNGGFKLALGEDGRLVLQHDPTLNQDLQSQLLLQSIFGLNGLVLQPSIDQQVHSQTVQTIQQQSVQTIQQQTVQSQTIQTVQQQTVQPHTLQTIQPQIQAVQPQTVQQTVQQTIQHQTVQSQPMQIVQPQPIHTLQPHNIQQHTIQSPVHQIQSLLQSQPLQTIHTQQSTPTIQSHHQTVQSQPILKVQPFQKSQPPVQTVHPQPIHHHHHHHGTQQNLNEHQTNNAPPASYVVNLTPEQLEHLKRNGQLTVNGQTIFMQRPTMTATNNNNKTPEPTVHQPDMLKKMSPKMKPVIKKVAKVSPPIKTIPNSNDKVSNHVKETNKSSLITALQAPPKIIPQQKTVAVQPTVQSSQTQTPKPQVTKTQTAVQTDSQTSAPEVDQHIGQILDESQNTATPPQRIHTIQLTHQQQQHLKNIQQQIQTLSSRLIPNDSEMHTALKMLFAEQQKILASGKLLPPDKVIYQNNQLTIINPSSLGIGTAPPAIKPEPAVIRNENSVNAVQTQQQVQTKITLPIPTPTSVHQNNVVHPIVVTATSTITTPAATTTTTAGQTHPKLITSTVQPIVPLVQQNKYIPSFTKAQLLEQQLNTDQNGAMKPDIHTPFRDKADACKRLIRYHCYNQPVLSQKDLNKADEIFELTARHFIDKFSKMVEKYQYLLLKQSMKQVETSELMMLDRLFLAEEQESLMRLRQELQDGPPPEIVAQFSEQPEEYDEWACIQRELGCLPDEPHRVLQQAIAKRSSSSDLRLESLKKFRVDKHSKRPTDLNNSLINSKAPFSSQMNVQCQSIPAQKHGFNHLVRHHQTYPTNSHHTLSHLPQDIAMQMQSQPLVYNSVNNKSQSSESESGNNSLDEHVQSAIDSILNLQQNSNMDLDEAVSSILS